MTAFHIEINGNTGLPTSFSFYSLNRRTTFTGTNTPQFCGAADFTCWNQAEFS